MSLEQQIQSDIKAAMVAKDKVALAATRAVKAAILLAKTSEGGAKDSLEDSEVVKIVQKLVKQRKESAEIYSQQNRQDLADNELAEAAAMKNTSRPLSPRLRSRRLSRPLSLRPAPHPWPTWAR